MAADRSDSPNGMKVLAAEDNPVFQAMLGNLLKKWGYDVRVARDGLEAWSVLQSPDAPRLAIMDWMMPGLDGVEICRRVRSSAAEPYIYILLLTARTQAEDLVQGMEAGADDYLKKPFNAHELRVRLRAGRRVLDLQEQLMHAREALREQATRDGLTGLWNRTTVLDLLGQELARAARERKPLGVLMADLDHFKLVNDTHGHLAGDAVLRETARRMRAVARPYDATGRYGGEEFIVIVPNCDYMATLAHAERLRAAIAAQPFDAAECQLRMTCSVGMAWSASPSPRMANELLRDADAALYAAKKQGRNRVEPGLPEDMRALAI
jgi:two-component system, cell cycle response regulator